MSIILDTAGSSYIGCGHQLYLSLKPWYSWSSLLVTLSSVSLSIPNCKRQDEKKEILKWAKFIIKKYSKFVKIQMSSYNALTSYNCNFNSVCQWLATGQWFSPGTPISTTNKTDHHDITEIFLKVALNTINPPTIHLQ